MEIKVNKNFLKDLAKLPVKEREKIEEFIFKDIPAFDSFAALKVQKLKGYQIYYKIRFGNYRVGLSYKNNVITIERVLHRKDIYKYFP